ncbi:MAG: hypothetical protein ACI8W8_002281 [Rhodothermales bacterium]|jgi:hypothetical protein
MGVNVVVAGATDHRHFCAGLGIVHLAYTLVAVTHLGDEVVPGERGVAPTEFARAPHGVLLASIEHTYLFEHVSAGVHKGKVFWMILVCIVVLDSVEEEVNGVVKAMIDDRAIWSRRGLANIGRTHEVYFVEFVELSLKSGVISIVGEPEEDSV